MAKTPDQTYVDTVEKARGRHAPLIETAQVAYEKAKAEADAALAQATAAHEKARADLDKAHQAEVQRAHAELARASKAALAAWNDGERARIGVPTSAFMRKTQEGRLVVHGAPGMPPVGTAVQLGGTTWEVDSEQGRVFTGSELEARRILWTATVTARNEAESGALAG